MQLKSTFLALKKSGTICLNCREGVGGRGNLDKIQKNSYFCEAFPKTAGIKFHEKAITLYSNQPNLLFQY